MNNIQISVIVPVYNSAAWLRDCIANLLAQATSEVEILLIDDGSTDGSSLICDEISQKSSSVRVIHQINGGVSSARNTGLSLARGTYVCFVDSDDLISPCCLPVALAYQHQYPNDIVFWQITSQKDSLDISSSDDNLSIDPSTSIAAMHMAGNLCPIYNKLYQRSLLLSANIAFQMGQNLGEDMMFNLDYFLSFKKEYPQFRLIQLPHKFYYYNPGNENSITHIYNPSFCSREIELFERLRSICSEIFLSPEEQLTRIDLHYLRTLAEGIEELARMEGKSKAKDILSQPELSSLCHRLKLSHAYSPYLYLVSKRKSAALCWLAAKKRTQLRTYERLYWVGWWLHSFLTGKKDQPYL